MLQSSVIEFLKHNVSPICEVQDSAVKLPHGLQSVLDLVNGFYAFGGALLFRPLSKDRDPRGITEWNDPVLWKAAYPFNLSGVTFFAEDVFGYQFGMDSGKVVRMDPESGEFEGTSDNVQQFLEQIISNPGELTGDVFLDEWRNAGGHIRAGERLVARRPFVCGGEFTSRNFALLDEVTAMRVRGELATNLRNVDDGEEVVFQID